VDGKVDPENFVKFLGENGIKIRFPKKGSVKWRFMIHHYIRDKEAEKIIGKVKEFHSSL